MVVLIISPSTKILEVLRDVITERLDLVLGLYRTKYMKDFLENISLLLQRKGYIPQVVENFKEIKYDTARQKLHCLLSLCNFVITDDSEASGEIVELEYCRNVGVVTAILSQEKRRSSWMTLDFEIHSSDFKSFDYATNTLKELNKILNNEIIH